MALGGLVWGASALAATGGGDLTDANITYVGRWDKSNSSVFKSYWSGAYLTTKFSGRSLKLSLNNPVAMNFIVNIDGNLSNYWAPAGQSEVNLTPTLLANGTHTVQIINKFNEGEFGFVKLQLDAGAATLPLEPAPLVEFIGDSITAGHGTTNWAVSDFAWQTGERLGALHTQIAFSGITLADYHHYAYNTFPGMESAYFKLMSVARCPDVPCTNNPAWNFANYSPRIVVVNLGTNDQNLGANSTSPADFQSKYTAFLANIRAKHPNADIFALRTFNGYYADQTLAAVNARIAAKDAKVHYIDTTGWVQLGTSDFNDGFHPSDSGHLKITDRLLPHLLPYVGVATVNDSQFSYDNTSSWGYGWQTGTFQGDNHWSSAANAYYQVPFTGTQIKLYGSLAPQHGIAAVSVDGGPETQVDTYAASRADGVLLWGSPQLAAGSHTLKVRVTGNKNISATNSYITADRADVVNGGLNLLSNAGFDDQLGHGWNTVTAGASQAVRDTAQPRSGSAQLKHWSASPYWAATFQTLTGLSNGLYTLKAWVRSSGGDQKMYVKNHGGADVSATLNAAGSYVQVVIPNVNVTNGNAEVGFWTNDPWGNGWITVDDVTFYKQ
jgi:hypothetical protein